MNARVELHMAPGGPVDASAFAAAVQAFVPLVREADAGAEWIIEDLRPGSAHLTVVAPRGGRRAEQGLSRIFEGLAQLRVEPRIPDGFTNKMVQWAQHLAESGSGVSVSADATIVSLDEAVAHNAQEAVRGRRESIVSVEGVFDRLNEREGRHVVGMKDRTGRAVKCTFQDALRDEILDALRSRARVVAWGRLRRNGADQKTELDLWDIEEVTSDPAPSVDDLVGIFGPGWKGTMNSAEWVRAQRESRAGENLP